MHNWPVITLWQPWAQWVALGWKTIETRTHDKFKGLAERQILIHCGQKWDDNACNEAYRYLSLEQLACTRNRDGIFRALADAPGCIIASAYVSKHIKLDAADYDERRALIECTTKRFGLLLENVQLVNFTRAKGKQGIWYQQAPVKYDAASRSLFADLFEAK